MKSDKYGDKAASDLSPTTEANQKVAPAAGEQIDGESSLGLRILLAEDNVVNRSFAQMILERDGHSVTCAINGREALNTLQSGASFDLVLMDVSMPVLDGLEATRCIRRPDDSIVCNFKDIPIIAMTAFSDKGDRQRCMDAGMDDYVAKPLDWEELTRVMHRVMQTKGRVA